MSPEERQQAAGLALGIIGFVTYWAVVIVRAATDGLPFTEVAWEMPMLLVVGIGGGLYGAAVAITRRVADGVARDERDRDIERYGEFTGSGLVNLTVLAALVMLALDASTFWTAQVLFTGTFLGSLAGSGARLAAYREGIPS